jgi:hypothetical protein
MTKRLALSSAVIPWDQGSIEAFRKDHKQKPDAVARRQPPATVTRMRAAVTLFAAAHPICISPGC